MGAGRREGGKAGRGQMVGHLGWERLCSWQWGTLEALFGREMTTAHLEVGIVMEWGWAGPALWSPQTPICISALPLVGCARLHRLLDLSEAPLSVRIIHTPQTYEQD